MWIRVVSFAVVAVLGTWLGAAAARAASRVEIEIVTAGNLPVGTQQHWYQLFTELKVDGLHIRTARMGDKAEIKTTGSEAKPVYRVTALLTSDGLSLPGARFKSRDRTGLAGWLKNLRDEGPERVMGGRELPFGMPSKQLEAVNEDLKQEVGFSTKGLAPAEAVGEFGKKLRFPLVVDRAAAADLNDAEPIGEELKGVSAGTALAYVVRSPGLVLEPRLGSNRRPEYAVKKPGREEDAWPIGHETKQRRDELLPEFFEMKQVEVDDYPLDGTLNAIGEQIEAPILYDHYSLARQGIEPRKAKVSYKPKKMSYARSLQSMLFKHGLNYEIRVDEAGKPFLWISTIKKVR